MYSKINLGALPGFFSVVFIPLSPPPPPFQPENILLTAREGEGKAKPGANKCRCPRGSGTRSCSGSPLPDLGKRGGFNPHPPPNSRSGDKTQPGRKGWENPPPTGAQGPPPHWGDGGLGEEPPKLAGDPSSIWRGVFAFGQVAKEDLGQLWLDLGGFSLQLGLAMCGIFWRGKCWERQQHSPVCAPLAAGVRDEGGWRVWGTQRGGMKEGWRVWGLAVPSNTKTLRGPSPALGTGPSPLLLTHPGAGPAPRGLIPSSREKSQRGPEQTRAGRSQWEQQSCHKGRDRNSPRQS